MSVDEYHDPDLPNHNPRPGAIANDDVRALTSNYYLYKTLMHLCTQIEMKGYEYDGEYDDARDQNVNISNEELAIGNWFCALMLVKYRSLYGATTLRHP